MSKFNAFGNDENLSPYSNCPPVSSSSFQEISFTKAFIANHQNKEGYSNYGSLRASPTRGASFAKSVREPRLILKHEKIRQTSFDIVVVGDSKCGKTSLITVFTGENKQANDLISTYKRTLQLDKTQVKFNIWDVSGNSNFDRIRPLSYVNASGIICCFAIDSLQSLRSVEERWIPELHMYCGKNCPIILVGLKKDLRNYGLQIPSEICQRAASRLGIKYYECSSRMNNVDFIFEELTNLIMHKKLQSQPTELPLASLLAQAAVQNCSRPTTSYTYGSGTFSSVKRKSIDTTASVASSRKPTRMNYMTTLREFDNKNTKCVIM